MDIECSDPLADSLVAAIHSGDVPALAALLEGALGLAAARLHDGPRSYTLLHVATDWPGHFPHVRSVVDLLVDAGADVSARYAGPHDETPLHWAASSDDVEALDALLDRGADIDAAGAVIAGGTPLADARAFAQWRAAHRLVERGATTTIGDEATLGLMDRLAARFDHGSDPDAVDIDRALWGAGHGGQLAAVRFLLDRGATIDWVPDWEDLTPLDAAVRSGRENGVDAEPVVELLRGLGARSFGDGRGA
jgi:ankyrin repeat protein